MLDRLDALAERLDRVVRQDGDALGGDDGAGVDALVDVVDRGGGLVDAGRENVLDRVRAGEVGQRRRVRVHDPTAVVVEERPAEEVHVPGADH